MINEKNMERIQVTITQEKNGTDGTISVTASRNGQNCFNETFHDNNLSEHPLHTLSAENIEGTEGAENSVSANLLWNIVSDYVIARKPAVRHCTGRTKASLN